MGKTVQAFERAERESMPLPSTAMPLLTQPPRSASGSTPDFESPAFERYEGLGHRVINLETPKPTKAIMFTGTGIGDGCSTSAINFAAALVLEYKRKVLLIDADLRNPVVHESFNIPRSPGLSDILDRKADFSRAIHEIASKSLYVLTCGTKPRLVSGLFENSEFENLLTEARQSMDYVVLDTPPVGIYPESRAISSRVDGSVLVIYSGRTRRQVALRAKQLLERSGAPVMGVLLNRRKYYIPEWLYARL